MLEVRSDEAERTVRSEKKGVVEELNLEGVLTDTTIACSKRLGCRPETERLCAFHLRMKATGFEITKVGIRFTPRNFGPTRPLP